MKDTGKIVTINGEGLKLFRSTYNNNGRVALELYDDEGPYATASVNVDDDIPEDHIAIKNYSENEGVLDALVAAGVVERPSFFVESGWVQIPVCKLLI